MFLEGKFPRIEHIEQLREKVAHCPEIRFTQHPNGFTTACYMIGNNDLWEDPNSDWIKECRGITFDRSGFIAARSLHKFFNVGERPTTQRGLIDWSLARRAMDKRDGSMISPVMVDGKVQVKSKKAFTSDVAVLAQAFIEAHANYYRFCEVCAEIGATPVFEYTSPKARIVLNYGVEDLILLHIRYTVSGEYFDDASLRHLASNWDIPVVDTYPLDNGVHAYLDNLDTAENMEGYVFQFANGDMVKAKCKWYLDLHRKIVFIRKKRYCICSSK